MLVASRNSARFKEDGLLREIRGEDLLAQGGEKQTAGRRKTEGKNTLGSANTVLG